MQSSNDSEQPFKDSARTKWRFGLLQPIFWLPPLGLLAGAVILQRVATLLPETVDRIYSRSLYFYIGRSLSQPSRLFTFSVGEALLVVLPCVGLVLALWQTRRQLVRGVSRLEIILARSRGLVWFAGVFFLCFLLIWGLNYQRTPIAHGMGLTDRKANAVDLEMICRQIIEEVNRNFEAARGTSDWSAGSRLSLSREELFDSIEEAYQREGLLREAARGGFGPPKPVYFSRLMSRLGVSGIYSPLTGEPNFNAEQPDCEIPFAIAHEKAHQRGYAREDEASFIAFLTCTKARHPYVRYSGFLRGLKVLAALQPAVPPERYREIVSELAGGPRNDLRGSAEFWRRSLHPLLGRVAEQANDTYLRANRVQTGIRNYGEVVSLIISYYLTSPENLVGAGLVPARSLAISSRRGRDGD
jgi:hypothetical protein